MAKKLPARIFKGTRDFLPEQMIERERIVDTMRSVFQKYGFAPIETPAIEYLQVLSGKYGEDADRLIYRLNYKTGTKDEAALHYDLTVPFSRFIAMNPQLPKPFKRYQIQPVWRADRPQPHQGRFREFYQCDIDAVGSKSMMVDAEIITITSEILEELGFDNFQIKINNRKILNGLVQYIGLDSSFTQTVCRSIDKLDKISFEEVADELKSKEVNNEAIQKIKAVFDIKAPIESIFDKLSELFAGIDLAQEGLKEAKELFAFLNANGVPAKNLKYDISLARGLDYYTGTIFETKLPEHPHMGSLTGGGRYDELIGLFSGVESPAVGTSLGLDRIFTAMQQLGLLNDRKSRTQYLIINFEDTVMHCLELAKKMRTKDVNVEVYPTNAKLKKQFSYADKQGIPNVITIGGLEVENGEITLKNLETGKQEKIKPSEFINSL